jgi:hypothetical protein
MSGAEFATWLAHYQDEARQAKLQQMAGKAESTLAGKKKRRK